MKKLMIIGSNMLFSTLLSFAQSGRDSVSKNIDHPTSGYSSAGTIGLIILLLVIVAVIIALTWRKKPEQ